MRGIIIAWGVAEGIVIYRSAKQRIPPRPGQLLATSGAFVLLALLAEAAPELATTIGVGIDIAALFQVWPGSGQVTPAAAGALASGVASGVATGAAAAA
jgi:hypothetical protein